MKNGEDHLDCIADAIIEGRADSLTPNDALTVKVAANILRGLRKLTPHKVTAADLNEVTDWMEKKLNEKER